MDAAFPGNLIRLASSNAALANAVLLAYGFFTF